MVSTTMILDKYCCHKNGLERQTLLDKHGLDKHDSDKHGLDKHGLDIKKIACSLGLTSNLVWTNHNFCHCADSGLGESGCISNVKRFYLKVARI